MGERGHLGNWPPSVAPALDQQQQRDADDVASSHWRTFDSSVNAVSFGFVATAVLISMFLVMAIFERFLRPPTSPENNPAAARLSYRADVESGGGGQAGFADKLRFPSPKVSTIPREVSVLMPGEKIPSFIAQPAPVPCAPERIPWPAHQHMTTLPQIPRNSNSSTSPISICEQ